MNRLSVLMALVAGVLWLTGCNQAPQGTEVTVRLVNTWGTPATATVVYQVGDGEWNLATQKDYGVYAFTVPPEETRYGVAVNCVPGGAFLETLGWAKVYQLTLDDTKELKVNCLNYSDQSFANLEVRAHAGGGDHGYNHAWYYTGVQKRTAVFPNAVSLWVEAKKDRDVLVVAYSDTSSEYRPDLIRRIKFLRDFDASKPPLSLLDVELTSADEPASQTVRSFTPPTWSSGSFFGVGFVSEQGLMVPHSSERADHNPALGMGDKAGGTYFKLPNTREGDVYYAEATAWDATGTYYANHVHILDFSAPEIVFDLPSTKFDPSVEETSLPTFRGLEYGDPDLVGFAFFSSFPSFEELIIVSKAWLGNQGSYTVPDLTSAPDFGGTRPLKGDRVEWQAMAVMANRAIGEVLSGDPLPLPNPLPRLPGLWIKTASKRGMYIAP